MNPAPSRNEIGNRRRCGVNGETRVLIAAGGSGGHIFPAIALAQRLKEDESLLDILFVGSNRPLDKRIFEKESLRYQLLSSNKLPYKLTPQMFAFFIKLSFDIIKAFLIMESYKPHLTVGLGGYASCPILFASYILKVPCIVHEQNVSPGRANRILFKMAKRIAISFDETRGLLGRDARKAVFTGNPIRVGNLKDDRELGMRKFGLDRAKFTVLVIGGSQGAHFLNKTFIKALSKIDEKIRKFLQVIHITGAKDCKWAMHEYESLGLEHRVHSFIDRIEEAYSASDLVVTRSGASAIFEIAFFGRPMILVPYPFAMSHQIENAAAFSKNGAAIKIDECARAAEVFKDTILDLLNDRAKLERLAERAKSLSVPEASRNLAREVLHLIQSN